MHQLSGKKLGQRNWGEVNALEILNLFETDSKKYTFISVDPLIIEQARILLFRYGKLGLRALDSIQLSTCQEIRKIITKYLTADKLLEKLLIEEGLPI